MPSLSTRVAYGLARSLTEDQAADLFVEKDAGVDAWSAATGTESRAALASYAGQTISDPPTQAEVQALDNAVVALSRRVVALINDLRANGGITGA